VTLRVETPSGKMLIFRKTQLQAMKRSAPKARGNPQQKAKKTARSVDAVVHPKRLHSWLECKEGKGRVVAYWMSRDQRVSDNWAMVYAQNLCEREEKEMVRKLVSVLTIVGRIL
jgi:hypothetical protein